MQTRSRNPFTTITTAGLLLPVDLLTRVAEGDPDLKGLSPKDYHLRSGERLNEAASRAWNECLTCWKQFRKKFAALPASDAGTTLTRDEWLLPLFQELGYGRLQAKKAIEIEGKEYPISHGWENHVPIHLLSARLPLDRRTPGISGAATRAPYSLLQEQLNRSAKHRWGFVTNGLKLFLLRDNAALARAANVEFDLEAMMDGEHYADFMLMFLLCHQSRLEIAEDGKPEDCWLEKWANLADSQGTRAREKLRDGVETAIKSLGAGFLTTKGNSDLRERLRTGELATQDYYRQLLRVVYRLLMLLVAEEKKTENGDNLLHPTDATPEVRDRYARFYSVSRIRSLAYERRGTAHTDLYESLKVLFLKLRDGYEPLGIPGMGSFLFSDDSTPDLDDALLGNQDLLDAFRNLCYTEDTSGRGGSYRRPVDFGNLGSEELGSVYESLLELHPLIDTDEGPFTLGTAAGNERKTSGSYYTPTSLINCLLDSALDPVVHEAIDVSDPVEAERKLLDLKVCDPACGSGHFLIAAAERMAMHLARIRTGDDQPNTLDVQHAKRDIIGRCIYGVDINPMSVELCKVSLWMEALEPGRPLSFLDHHIQCGNSLLGTTPALLKKGIPDDAFKPIEGDVKAMVTELKRDNKKQRKDYEKGQGQLFEPYIKLGNLPGEFSKLSSSVDDSVADIAEKERRYAELVSGADYQNARLLADTWCAVFVWQKDTSDLGKLCPTERDFRKIENNPHSILPHVKSEVRRLAGQYQFFHWHLAFPDVFRLPDENTAAQNEQTGWNDGFDVMLGNPPWGQIQLDPREFFAEIAPEVANARNMAARNRAIASLETKDPALFAAYFQQKRFTEGTQTFIHDCGRFPLSSVGRLNSAPLFCEQFYRCQAPDGRVGLIVPTGIATDSFTQHLFKDFVTTGSLVSLFDFENRLRLFQEVAPVQKFCLLTLCGTTAADKTREGEFAFFLTSPPQLQDKQNLFTLAPSDFSLLNPNTLNCPIFRNGREAEITKAIYRRIPVLSVKNDVHESSPWNFSGLLMFMMNSGSELFRTADELTAEGFTLNATSFHKGVERYLPLLEGKFIQQFDHRHGGYEVDQGESMFRARAGTVTPTLEQKQDPDFGIAPRYWTPRTAINDRLAGRWSAEWMFCFRDIVRPSTDTRCCVMAVVPRYASGDTAPMAIVNGKATSPCCFLACMNSLPLDFATRNSIGGTHLRFSTMQQLPVIPPEQFDDIPFLRSGVQWIAARVLELTYTAWDLGAFALDCGYSGPPFRWDEERRFLLRCELDAAYFHLYLGSPSEWGNEVDGGLGTPDGEKTDQAQSTHHKLPLLEMFPTPRDAVSYIMETFPIVKRKDIKRTTIKNESGEVTTPGTYITKDTILTIYDQMQQAIENGEPYQTSLNPPPGPPTDAEGNVIPTTEWDESNWPSHIHPPRKAEVP